jgi:hypothetical protein
MVICVADGLWLTASCVDGKNQIVVIEEYVHFGTVSDPDRGDLPASDGFLDPTNRTNLSAWAVPSGIGARLCNC